MSKEKLLQPNNTKYSMKGSRLHGIFFGLLLLLIDQLTKLVADVYFNLEGSPSTVDVIPGWIFLRIDYNPGIAYGIGHDAPPPVKIAVIVITAVIMLVLSVMYLCLDRRRSWLRSAFVLIVSGGVGNLIDRLYYRVWEVDCLFGVRDMVDLNRFGFALCNFADFFICIGAVVMVLALLFFDRDAMFPLGKKYKALAKEEEARLEAKKQAKELKKKAKNG